MRASPGLPRPRPAPPLAKVTLLLAIAWLVHFGLARANPRWRTLLWRGAVVSLAPLAVWTLGLPGVEIRVEAAGTGCVVVAAFSSAAGGSTTGCRR